MKSALKAVPLAPRHLVVGLLASLALGGAMAATAPPQGNNAPGSSTAGGTAPGPQADQAEKKKPGAQKDREVRRGPVRPERGNYEPVIPPKHVIIPK